MWTPWDRPRVVSLFNGKDEEGQRGMGLHQVRTPPAPICARHN
jgi:hypothetical protein